ncbi:hypothetical protein GGR56DRAFT_671979 [Xylariaceae sp. FL0804]|nr:hypothetical protein GGR56DRAFT_671979 [Xylariaceae sp. FL0804]
MSHSSSSFSPYPAYALAALLVGLALNSFASPRHEHERYGLPLEDHPQQQKQSAGAVPAPASALSPTAAGWVYVKGTREISYGVVVALLQYQGLDTALTSVLAVVSFLGLADGYIVGTRGGSRLRHKAAGHGLVGVCIAGWAWWRARVAATGA